MSYINGIEKTLYFFGWIGSVLYSMYSFQTTFESNGSIIHSPDGPDFLSDGWKWTGRKRDSSDFEWFTFSSILYEWLPYVAVYLIGSQVIRRYCVHHLPTFSFLISLLWMSNSMGWICIVVLLQPLIFFWIYKYLSLKFVWAACLISTILLNDSYFTIWKIVMFDGDNMLEYSFAVMLAWTQARSISYLHDISECDSPPHSYKNLIHYCFYLPLLPTGPLMLYRDFQKSIQKQQLWSTDHLLSSLFFVMRHLFWCFIYELTLHYMYHSAAVYFPYFVKEFGIWAAGGLGISLGHFFMLKYKVLYGLPSSLARVDHVLAPPGPKCVSRIHLYSEMWKDFDRGLHDFMFNYIYIPYKGASRTGRSKLLGSALCFAFICIWHGASSAVIAWCLTNYLGYSLEMVACYCSSRSPVIDWKKQMSESNWLRLQALVCSPLLLMSLLSNFCFLSDAEIGTILVDKAIFQAGFVGFSAIMLVMYCFSHVSIAVTQYEKERSTKRKIT